MNGQGGQQVLIKYGSNYVKVHLCRLSLEKNNSHNSDTQQAISPKCNINEKNNFNSENNSCCSNTIYDSLQIGDKSLSVSFISHI